MAPSTDHRLVPRSLLAPRGALGMHGGRRGLPHGPTTQKQPPNTAPRSGLTWVSTFAHLLLYSVFFLLYSVCFWPPTIVPGFTCPSSTHLAAARSSTCTWASHSRPGGTRLGLVVLRRLPLHRPLHQRGLRTVTSNLLGNGLHYLESIFQLAHPHLCFRLCPASLAHRTAPVDQSLFAWLLRG